MTEHRKKDGSGFINSEQLRPSWWGRQGSESVLDAVLAWSGKQALRLHLREGVTFKGSPR